MTRRSLAAEHRSLTRERLLDGAVAVLAEKALVDVTMGEIAAAAGTTRVTLYAHFPGKTGLVEALADRLNEVAYATHAAFAARPRWGPDEVRAWVEAVAGVYRAQETTIRALVRAGPSMTPATLQAVQESWVALLLGDGARWARVPAGEARQRVLMAVLTVESLLTEWLVHGRDPGTDEPLDLLTTTVLGLLAPALVDRDPGPTP